MSKCLMIIEKNASGKIGLRKAKQRGLKVVMVSSNKYSNRLKPEEMEYVDELIEVDTNNIELTVQKCIEFSSKTRVDGVMTFFEYYVPVAAHVAEALKLSGIPVNSVYNARNKYLMREAFKRGNVPTPRYKPIHSIEEAAEFASAIGYPNVIKPVNLGASRGVYKNCSIEDLANHYDAIVNAEIPYGMRRDGMLLLEEYMEGQEYSVETVCIDGEVHVIAITKKLVGGGKIFAELGHAIPAVLEPSEEEKIRNAAILGIKALGLIRGVTHTEIKMTSEGPRIVEIGARLGGDHIPELVELSLGIDLWNAAISLALDEKPDITPKINRGAAIRFLTAEPGRLENIEGIEDAKKLPGIHEVLVETNIGHQIKPLCSNTDRLGHIIAVGDTSLEAEADAERALKAIKLFVSKS